ncbi:MAG: CHAP domain-containing protein [Clostridia bacterium]|nr:CHAP domain-containing protein [Clostridia bacterium]
MHSNRAKWKDIFSIYAVEVLNQPQGENIDSLYDMMKSKVKEIFWKMHTITFRVEETEKDIEYINDDGTKRIEKKMVKVLYIDVSSKTLEEMMNEYNFIEEQKSQVAELQKDEFNEVWKEVLSNSLLGSQSIVDVAKTQIGNVGGEPYWSWYGFEARVEWCACFVSWCANECGYIDSGAIPKFAECQEHGVEWFQGCGLWQDRTSGYEPKAGDIIFFDWMDKHDGSSDHVGIVEKCENETVYTIEGNTKGDCCKQNEYNINSEVIMGYGTPLY